MAQKSPGMVKQKKIRCNSNWSAQDIIKQLNGDPVKKKNVSQCNLISWEFTETQDKYKLDIADYF